MGQCRCCQTYILYNYIIVMYCTCIYNSITTTNASCWNIRNIFLTVPNRPCARAPVSWQAVAKGGGAKGKGGGGKGAAAKARGVDLDGSPPKTLRFGRFRFGDF